MPRTKATAKSSSATINNKFDSNVIECTNSIATNVDVKPKRRGRPPIKKDAEEKQAPKKRGRKPKGGKIITNTQINNNTNNTKENIIVHLKCSTSLLHKQPNNIYDTQFNTKNTVMDSVINNSTIKYFNINKENVKVNTMFEQANVHKYNNDIVDNSEIINDAINRKQNDDDKKKRKKENDIIDKLKELQQNLKHDNADLTESNCFWCTYSFENQPIHIPKHIIKDVYHVYGCFCSPECATAFLFNENIDNSTRFERYSLLCSLYTKIFKYDKNIKPAPNPYYTLEKYCGNLSIMEYRELFNSNRLLFVINKPVARELPELDIVDSNIYN